MEAVRALLAQLRAHAADAATVSQLCSQLKTVLFNNACGDALDDGSLEFLMKLQLAHAGHAGVQATTCAVLLLLFINPAHAHAAVGAGAIETLTAAMRLHAQSGKLQMYACGSLSRIMSHGYHVRISRAGAVELLVAALRTHAADEPTCSPVLHLLRDLTGTAAASEVGHADGVAAFHAATQAMRTHAASMRVQKSGCGALRSLCLDGVATATLAAGALDVVVAALRRHGAVDDVLIPGYAALLSLVNDTAIAKRAIAAGVLQLQTQCVSAESLYMRDEVMRCLNGVVADADAAMAALLAEEDAAPSKSKPKAKSKSKGKGKGKKAGGAHTASSSATADASAAEPDTDAVEAAAAVADAPPDEGAAAGDAQAVHAVAPVPVTAVDHTAPLVGTSAATAGVAAAVDAPPDAGASHAMLHELYPWLQPQAAPPDADAPPPPLPAVPQPPPPVAPLPRPPPYRPPMGHASASCAAAAAAVPSYLPPPPRASQPAACNAEAAAPLPAHLAGRSLARRRGAR
jgi:hypothetical protein